VCIHCFHCSFVSTFTNKTQVSSPLTMIRAVIIWLGTVREICGNSHESSENVKRRVSQFFWSTLWTDHLSSQMADRPLRSSSWTFFAHLWTFYTTVLQFLHLVHFGHKQRIIHDGFRQHSCFRAKKADNSANFAAGSIINFRTHHNFIGTRTTTRWPVMWWLAKQYFMWRYITCASCLSLLH
jgi:hypothetical protein